MEQGPRSSRVVFWVTGVHVVVVVAAVGVGLFRGCLIQPSEPKQLVSFVELVEPEPAPVQAPSEPEPAPEPPPPEPPPPEPPPKPKPVPKKIEVSKKRVKRTPTEAPPPPQKRLTAEEIRKNLALENSKPRPRTEQDDRAFDLYYAMVRRVMYGAWREPSEASVPPGSTAKVAMVVQRDGAVSKVYLARSSGNAVLDASALTAVRSVPKLAPLPEQYRGRSKEITIDFRLTGSGV
jgi:protein TonB